MNRKLITVLDVFIIFISIVLSVTVFVTFLFSDEGKKVVVSIDDQVVAEMPLNTSLTKKFETENGFNLVVISNGECYVEKADCRDGICVNRGKIHKIGESIVCLPHKLIVEIK